MKSKKILPQTSYASSNDDILDRYPVFQQSRPNPLRLFPGKADHFAKNFLSADIPKYTKDVEASSRWLHPDSIDPAFGIQGTSQEVQVRRSYRRMNSSFLFADPKHNDASLDELDFSGQNKRTNYVLVEESRLEELAKFENILRDEKERMAEQCAWAISDYNVNPRIPVPATRLAVHNLCESDMRKYAAEINKLNATWEQFCKDNHYEKQLVLPKDTLLNRMPLVQKAIKLRLVKEAKESHRLKRDQDTMQFEDDLSYLVGKYSEAQSRKRDYDRYYVLAVRYGAFSEEEYLRDNRPGKRYYFQALNGALKFQRLWDRYWAIARLTRYRAARTIQTRWRRFWARKKFYPLIRIRLKVGKRSYLFFCWYLWKDYVHLCKLIKESINWHLHTYRKDCFDAWAKYTRSEVDRKNQIKLKFVMRVRNAKIAGLFMAWANFAKRSKQVKTSVRRFIQFPEFDTWVRFTEWSKMMKSLNKASTKIGSMIRTFLHVRRYRKMREALRKLKYFVLIVLSRFFVRLLRKNIIEKEFSVWGLEEAERRLARANENERRRLQRLQQAMQERESKAVLELKKHFKSSHGKTQLKELRKLEWNKENWHERILKSKGVLNQMAETQMIRSHAEINRMLERHDLLVKQPASFSCAVPHCNAVFISYDQYLRHEYTSCGELKHTTYLGNRCVIPLNKMTEMNSFAKFHVMLCHHRGSDMLQCYFKRLNFSENCHRMLEAWVAIKEWKKALTTDKSYNEKAETIFDTFLKPNAPKYVNVSFDERDELIKKMEVFKSRSCDGFFKKQRATKNLLRMVLRFKGKSYQAWNEQGVFIPNWFDLFEWHFFINLFNEFANEGGYVSSPEFSQFQVILAEEKAAKDEALLNDYKNLRLHGIRTWSQDFLKREKLMAKKAYEAVDITRASLCNEVLDQIVDQCLIEKIADIRYFEQERHEFNALLADEVSYWLLDEIVVDLYENYSRSLLKVMWSQPDNRNLMLEFAGDRQKHVKKILLIDMNAKNNAKELFDAFLRGDHAEIDKEHEKDKAAIKIQKRFRGVLGRKLARKEFALTFVKKYDRTVGAYYYVNTSTGESSWDRPFIMMRLYPNSSW